MMRHRCGLILGIGVALLAAACSDRSPPPRSIDAGHRPRVLAPPPGDVRAAPPHAIHRDGIGPFLLGTSLSETLSKLAVPRVVLYQLDGVVDYSLVRAEDDALIIGVSSPGGVAYVTVLDKEIAKHSTGVGVGATRTALHKALGEPLVRPQRVSDPRIESFASLPNARFVIEGDRVSTVVVGLADRPRRKTPAPTRRAVLDAGVPVSAAPCSKSSSPPRGDILRVARLSGPSAHLRVTPGCFAGDASDFLVSGPGGFVVVDADGKKVRRLTGLSVPGAMWSAPLDIDADGRDEIAVVTRVLGHEKLAIWVALYRVDGGRLTKLVGRAAYEITATRASWIGASLSKIELIVELRGSPGVLQVGGLYVHHGSPRAVNIAPLTPKRLLVKQPRKPAVAAPAAPRDGGVAVPTDARRGHTRRRDASSKKRAPR